MNIAVFLPNWLGDLVMATPALRALRRLYGCRAQISGVVRPHLLEVLAGTNFLDEQRPFDPRSPEPEHRRWALVRWMRGRQFDLCLLLTHSFDTALMARLGGATARVGYARNFRGWLLSQRLVPQRSGGRIVPEPNVQTYLALAEAIGCPPEPPRLELRLTPEEIARADNAWQSLDLRGDGRVVALNNSGAYGAAKRWPNEHCSALARRIAEELDHDVLVICGPAERETARQIAQQADHRRVKSLDSLPPSIGLTKACLERCRLTISTDSGPRHVAAAFGRPVVTLMGPTLSIWIENPLVRGVDLRVPLECSGCGRRQCPLGHHRCMRDLTPELVFEHTAELLRREAVRGAA